MSDEQAVNCAECATTLAEGEDREVTDGGAFCRPCFNNLTQQLERVVAETSTDINYPVGVLGGLLGAAAGAGIWWGFTVVTNIAFGLVAVVIGYAAGKGIVLFTGGKRHLNLQILSAAAALIGFAYANYLVTRTFIQRAYADQGEELVLPLLPEPTLFIEVVKAGFSPMDLLFLGIVIWQAWVIPAPIRLQQ